MSTVCWLIHLNDDRSLSLFFMALTLMESFCGLWFAGTELPDDIWVQVDMRGTDRGGRACSTIFGSLMAPLKDFSPCLRSLPPKTNDFAGLKADPIHAHSFTDGLCRMRTPGGCPWGRLVFVARVQLACLACVRQRDGCS